MAKQASKGDLWPHKFGLPFVGAIIEREVDGTRQVLIQTRHNPLRDPRYTGTIEFPGGILDARFESVFDALGREIAEETGLRLKRIIAGDKGETTTTGRDDRTLGFQPFYCTQQLAGDYPWVGFIFVCEVHDDEPRAQNGETKNPRWVNLDDMRKIVADTPEQVFGLQLPAWKYYFDERGRS